MKIDLKKKVGIVTGGTRGIGKEIGICLASLGANLVIASRHKDEAENTARDLCTRYGVDCIGIRADISKLDDIRKMIKTTCEVFDTLDLLINNAGITIRLPAIDMSEAVWDEVVSTNLKGTFFCCVEAAKIMKQKKYGKIVNIGSVHSHTATKMYAHYSASKAGISQFTRVLALEWAEYGILVNCVSPGSIPTDINKEWLKDPNNLEKNIQRIPLGRLGSTKDISGIVAFLCSEYSNYITGQTLYVDGGWTL